MIWSNGHAGIDTGLKAAGPEGPGLCLDRNGTDKKSQDEEDGISWFAGMHLKARYR